MGRNPLGEGLAFAQFGGPSSSLVTLGTIRRFFGSYSQTSAGIYGIG